MSLENALAANVFASVLPWIERNDPIIFMHDQGGTNANAVPDLCFNFIGANNGPIRIEFKVVKHSRNGGSVSLTNKQVNNWCQSSTTLEKPHCWIGVDERGNYYFWEQTVIEPLIEAVFQRIRNLAIPRGSGNRNVPVPASARASYELISAFRLLLEFANQHHMCP
jgi:hypothetical protein